MGILDRLGLKGEDWSEFAEWFGHHLLALASESATTPGTDHHYALLLELDERVERFVKRRGDEELVRSLEAWVHQTEHMLAVIKTFDFHDQKAFEERLTHLERRHSAGKGLRKLDHALYCMGVLTDRLDPRREEQVPRPTVSAMLEVVWPRTPEEQDLRTELAGLMEAELARSTWELGALRLWTASCVLSIHFKDEPAGKELGALLSQQFNDRTRGEWGPPNLAEFLAHRHKDYFKLVDLDAPRSKFLTNAVIAGTFAWYCRRTLDLRVRLIGAREFRVAYNRLDAMVEAYKAL